MTAAVWAIQRGRAAVSDYFRVALWPGWMTTFRAGLTQVAGEVLDLVGELDFAPTPESGRALAALFPQARANRDRR